VYSRTPADRRHITASLHLSLHHCNYQCIFITALIIALITALVALHSHHCTHITAKYDRDASTEGGAGSVEGQRDSSRGTVVEGHYCPSTVRSTVPLPSLYSLSVPLLLSLYCPLYCPFYCPLYCPLYCPSTVPLLSLYCPSTVPPLVSLL
jgi:hypothetical protein